MNKFVYISLFVTLTVAGLLFLMVGKSTSRARVSTPPPSTTVLASTNTVSVMDSPEGSKTLTLEGDTLSVSSKEISEKQVLYKKTADTNTYLEIPFNTWSPDTKYLFIREKNSRAVTYLLFKSSGGPFADEKAFISITDEFQKKVDGYTLEEITGWADPTLLVVNVIDEATQNKRSFWFNVENKAFIPLSTYFK